MCGRYGLKTTFATLAKLLRAEPLPDDAWTGPDYNIAPTDPAPVLLVATDGRRQLGLSHWGLVPSWAKDTRIGARMINARAESIATKPAIRDAVRERRRLVPASGWYEWEAPAALATGAAAKPQPHWFYPPPEPARSASTPVPSGPDGDVAELPPEPLFLFAGLWARWRDHASGHTRHTFTIITTDAAPSARAVHDRMPVILPTATAQALWLAPDAEPQALLALLAPYQGPLAHHVVARTVNSVHNDGPALIAPLAATDEPPAAAPTPTPQPRKTKRQGELPL
jgi:putative SOS response-associated peptidase YedK